MRLGFRCLDNQIDTTTKLLIASLAWIAASGVMNYSTLKIGHLHIGPELALSAAEQQFYSERKVWSGVIMPGADPVCRGPALAHNRAFVVAICWVVAVPLTALGALAVGPMLVG